MNHIGTMQIETERLVLRRFKMQDAEPSFNNWTNDSKVTEFLRWQQHKDIKVTKQIFANWIENYKNLDFYQWAIHFKDIDEPIGTISAFDINEITQKVHIGYCIGSKWWNMGITSEALFAIIAFFFEKVGTNRIESMHDPNNLNSGKVMKKCGMKYEGTLRQADFNNQGIVDACMYSILASEYFQNK